MASQTPAASSLKDKLIIALDVPNAREARDLVRRIGDEGLFYKVGLQLFAAEGPGIVRDLVHSGKKVFLDLKFHDIPNTVAGAVKSASELGVYMLTVHATGGSKMLNAAAHAADKKVRVIAVTMLTSVGEPEMTELGYQAKSVEEQVLRLARLAQNSGCDGVVASPLEISGLRKTLGNKMLIVTPGIRPAGSKADDQSRVATATDAIRSGANHLVIGRPITGATDPSSAARGFLDEIALA